MKKITLGWFVANFSAIKRGFRDQHNFVPTGGTENDPIFDNIPDGDYKLNTNVGPCTIRVKNNAIRGIS